MKNVVIVSASPRAGGNSEILARKFCEGARAAEHAVRFVTVRELDLQFCIGCLRCQTQDKCVLKDGMNALYDSMQHADVLVFATPVYYYSVSGQLKTFLDRLNPLYPRDNAFRDVYLLATAAEADDRVADGAVTAVQGFVDCFDGVRLKGVLRGVGVTDKGDVNSTDFPARAYAMGKNV